jgi:Zn-finger nucleic acid-binding protein
MTVSLRSGITFDHCDDHGIWLDRGERDKFVVAFAFEVDGGLAR